MQCGGLQEGGLSVSRDERSRTIAGLPHRPAAQRPAGRDGQRGAAHKGHQILSGMTHFKTLGKLYRATCCLDFIFFFFNVMSPAAQLKWTYSISSFLAFNYILLWTLGVQKSSVWFLPVLHRYLSIHIWLIFFICSVFSIFYAIF